MQKSKLSGNIIFEDDLVKVGGIAICRRIVRNDVIYIQFRDYDRMRSSCRGTPYVEVPLSVLAEMLRNGTDWYLERAEAE